MMPLDTSLVSRSAGQRMIAMTPKGSSATSPLAPAKGVVPLLGLVYTLKAIVQCHCLW
jgi:hypothetical protein